MADRARVLGIPVLDEDPFDPAQLVDPYGFYERVRDAGPVVFLERYGVWAMGRHHEVAHALGPRRRTRPQTNNTLKTFRRLPLLVIPRPSGTS